MSESALDETMPVPGQIWVPRQGRSGRSRTVVWVGMLPEALRISNTLVTVGYVHHSKNPAHPATGHDGWILLENWRHWVHRTQAKLLPPGVKTEPEAPGI
jgi:hypothetical protein